MNYSINQNFCDREEAKRIVDFCLEYGEPFSYNPSEKWDCRRMYNDEFKTKIINILTEKYESNEFKLWFDWNRFDMKNFNISLTSYYDGRYLSLHKDKTSELTTVIVLSDGFDGGDFALTEMKTPPSNFKNLNGIDTFKLNLGDSISFDGTKTYHGVLPVRNGIRYALNVWMTETDFIYPKIKNTNSLL